MLSGSQKLRSACDNCHRSKIRCSGQNPCGNCLNSGGSCFYSYASKLGRPQGARNKQTVRAEKVRRNTASQISGNLDTNAGAGVGTSANTAYMNSASREQQTGRRASTISMSEGDTSQSPGTFDDTVMGTESTVNFDDINEYLRELEPQTFPPPTPSMQDNSILSFQTNFKETVDLDNFTYRNEILFPNFLGHPSITQGSVIASGLNADQIDAPKTDLQKQSEEISSFMKLDTTHCSCFEQLSSLLCSLKAKSKAASGSAPIPNINAALSSVCSAFQPWKSLAQCRMCAQNTDYEGLLLALMSVRIVTVEVYRAKTHLDSSVTSQNEVSSNDRLYVPEQLHEDGTWTNFNSNQNQPSILVGEYEVTGNDRTLLLSVLIQSMARKIKAAVQWFKEILDKKQAVISDRMSGFSSSTTADPKEYMEYTTAENGLKHAREIIVISSKILQVLEKPIELGDGV